MIKLFWNTHNQNKPDSEKSNTDEARDYIWGLYHKKNSDKWIYEILNKVKFQVVENENSLENGDILIIIDSSIQKKKDLYSKLQIICSKLYLIHLGDEGGVYNLSSIYEKFNFVWRGFCSNKYFNNRKVSCIPIGYKSGIGNIDLERKYKWTFIGTPHKSSRNDLLFQLSNIKPNFIYKTRKFNEKIIEVEEMRKILSLTEFVPCPNGFVHPETYRVYEALECGCIPIVENAYKYYDRLFPNNPFIKINKWLEAKSVVKDWDGEKINKKSRECQLWWINYKKKLQESIYRRLANERK